ncbi:KAT8 regulatory NSL complex subunit 1-like [Artemia franciscana]|uniref:PEHE domain-containing protein n=1 Tax=Artemia franciscana TaxID=6661 RepID=A0AA88KV54_ARTSF|nr:hypothetical protein QYM36_018062 [Artemia franciscana]KAK2703466.1 hypothetical protein QYM36_018062 [Artemia franciscana]
MSSISFRLLAAGLAMVPALSELQQEIKISSPNHIINSSKLDIVDIGKTQLNLDFRHCEYFHTIRELRHSSKEYPCLDPKKLNGILSPEKENCNGEPQKLINVDTEMCLNENETVSKSITMGHIESEMNEKSERKREDRSEIDKYLENMDCITAPNHVDDILDVIVDPCKFVPASSQDILAVLDSLNTPPLSCENGDTKDEPEGAAEKQDRDICVSSEKPLVKYDLNSKHMELLERKKRLTARFRRIAVHETFKHITSEMKLFMHYTENSSRLKEIREKMSSGQNDCDTKNTNEECKLRKYQYFGAGKCKSKEEPKMEVKLNDKIGRNIKDVSERWLWNLKSLKATNDSYATDSSSGGESDNEDDQFFDKCDKKEGEGLQKEDIYRVLPERAVWRWARERSAIASRWVWLKTRVADLERSITWYSKLESKLKAEKQGVDLGPSCDCEASSSRVRPILKSGKSFQRRRLVQSSSKTISKCAISSKQTKQKPVNCGCLLEKNPCFLCGGENKQIKNVNRHDSARLRISEIDGAFHPVLSARNEMPLSIHIDSLIHTGEWRTLVRTKPLSDTVLHRSLPPPEALSYRPETPPPLTKTDYRRHLSKSSGLLYSYLDKGSKSHTQLDNLDSDASCSSSSIAVREKLQTSDSTRHRKRAFDESDQDCTDSPASPAPSTSSAEGSRYQDRNMQCEIKRRGGYSNNHIVWPYAVAASTRIQVLQYKEIPTPSWRENIVLPDPSIVKAELEENTCDMVYKLRHDRAEILERRKLYSAPGLAFPAATCNEPDGRKGRSDASASLGDFTEPEESFIVPDNQRRLNASSMNLRKRNPSSSLKLGEDFPSSIGTEEEEELGFPRRRFPLSEYAYQALLTEADSAVNCEDSVRKKRLKLTPGMIAEEWMSYGESDDDK